MERQERHILTYNVKLVPENDKDKQLVIDTLEINRSIWNFIAKQSFKARASSRKIVHDACYAKARKKFPKAPAQVIIRAVQDVVATHKSLKANKRLFNMKSPATKQHLSMRLDKRLYNIIPGGIRLTTVKQRVNLQWQPYKRFSELLTTCTMCDPLIFERSGQLWLSVSFEQASPVHIDNHCIGVDLGIKRAFATSEGVIVKDKKFNAEKRRLRFLKRQTQSARDQQKAPFGNKRSRGSRRTLKRLKKRERNKNKEQSHKLARHILASTTANTIVLEDLNGIKKKNKGKRLNNRRSQVPFFQLRTILTCKAALVGKRVQTVDPAYTSQDDHRGLGRGERKGCRYYAVDGKVFDSDVQAAINIAQRHSYNVRIKHQRSLPVSFVEPLDGTFKPVQAGCAVNQPIVSTTWSGASSLL